MHTHFKIFRNNIVNCLFFLTTIALFSQQAIVNTTVIPPYDTPFDQLKTQVMIMVTNTSASTPINSSFLRMTIEGDNGINIQSISSFDYINPIFDINETQSLTLNGVSGDLDDLFEIDNLVFSGITANQAYNEGLPPGSYSLCFRVFDSDFAPISPEAPAGCTFFNILESLAIEPPQLIAPFCGNDITTGNNNIVFSWTTPPGASPSTIEYTLKMVELLPNQDPNQAFLASTIPAFFERSVYTQTSILYGPSDPPLESGKTYAWQVIANDDELDTPFLNEGRSEVCWFTYKPTTIDIIPIVATQTEEPTLFKSPTFNIDPQPMPISSLKGRLLYKFKGSGRSVGSGGNNRTNPNASNNIGNPNIYNVDPNPIYSFPGDKPQVPKEGFYVSTSGANPLGGVSVSLVVTHLFNGKDDHGEHTFQPIDSYQAGYLSQENQQAQDQILATTITDIDGNFNFENFINPHEDYGLVQADIDATQSSDVRNMFMKGDIYKVLRLKVNNQYYLSPDVNITINPFESKDIGEVVSLVKSYNLKVKAKWIKGVMDVQGGAEAYLTGVKLNVVRTHIPNGIPDNEGDRESINSGFIYTVVGTRESTPNGVVFKNLVQHSPTNSKDKYRIITTKSSTSNVTYRSKSKSFKPKEGTNRFPYVTQTGGPTSGNAIGAFLGSNTTWNHELKIEEYEDTIELIPNKPKISGVVKTDEAKLPNEWVLLINAKKSNKDFGIPLFQKTKTNTQGRYRFDNLDLEHGKLINTEDSSGKITSIRREIVGPERTLLTAPKGFKGLTNYVGIQLYGSQYMSPDADFNLEPDGYFSGYVIDDEGNSIKAHVNVDSLTTKKTSFGFLSDGNNTSSGSSIYPYTAKTGTYRQHFAFKAPSGKRQVIVKAEGDNEANYSVFNETVTITKMNVGNTKPIEIILIKKKKRVRFKVLEHGTTAPIANARVTLKDIAGYETPKLTDNDGYVSFAFENAASDFVFAIKAPEGKENDYTTEVFEVFGLSNTTKFSTPYNSAYLKATAKISGIVTIGVQPLQDAKVFFQVNSKQIETKTDKQGKYTLKGISKDIGSIELTASKSSEIPNVISKTKTISIQAENTVDFSLKYDREVSVTSIFGFDVEIIKKEKQSDGSYIIKQGNIINIPRNDNFKLRDATVVLPFSNLEIKKTGENDSSGTPVFEPKSNQVTLNDKTVELKLNNAFNVILGNDTAALKLTNNNSKGQIKATVGVENSSFSTNNITLENEDVSIYLTPEKGNTSKEIIALAIDNPNKNSFGIVNPEGEEFTFKLGNFDAIAKQDKSQVSSDKITLYTHLKTQHIEGLTPNKLEIEAGDLVIQPKRITPINNSNPLKFKLEKWNFESKNWVFDTETIQLVMANGLIKTGSINVPVKNVTLSSSEFDISDFNLNQLSLGGIATLNVIGNSPSFWLNPNVGKDNQAHWELKITGENNSPAAKLQLPGFETGKSIDFAVVSLLSNGEEQSGIANNESMRFYNIIDVKPTGITTGDGYIDITSMTNLGIPKIPESAGFIRYIKENGELKVQVAPVPFALDAPGKVTLSVGNNPKNTEIREGFFKAIGTLTDEEGISLQASIQKTNSKIHIEVEPGQNMKLGGSGTSFKDIEGKIELDNNNNWKKLTFSGELDGFKGVTSGQRQTFTVHGDITADKESINVDNIETPFGDLALTYDIKNSRFLGHLNINQPLGGMKFVGAADMLMGSEGWYFSAGGKGTPPGIGEVSVGMILGDSDYLAPDVTGNLMQFAYDKNVPPTIKNGVSGLFVTGQKVIPIINIPDWSIDLGVLNASLGAKAGLDARVWMNFDSSGDEFGIGAMAFAHVYFKASSITCTSLGAEARAELGIKGKYQTATGHFSLDGCGSIMVGGHIRQCVPTIFAGCKWCASIGFSEAVKLDLHLDSGGKTDVSFGFGNCSKAPLSSGW